MIGILGSPVHHSLSPLIHNTALQNQKLNFVYVAVDLPSERLLQGLHGLRALGFAGANVTIPHKESVLPHMDHLSDIAKSTGAVNTIVCKEDGLYGENTDIGGFLAPLKGRELDGSSITVLGAGGAARAAVYGLLQAYRPGSLTIVARRLDRAEALIRSFPSSSAELRVSDFASASKHIRQSRLIVNCTPVGMYPKVQRTPWTQKEDFSPGQIVYDLIYRPHPTRLLQEASSRGATVIGGLTMLIEQAAASYRLWTHQRMPVSVVRTALAQVFTD